MAALPTNDQVLDRCFQSDDDDCDFEGFSEVPFPTCIIICVTHYVSNHVWIKH
jgi:hypothetical protein